MIAGAFLAAASPLAMIFFYALYVLSIINILMILDAIISYWQTGEYKYASQLMGDLLMNIAFAGVFKVLEWIVPGIKSLFKGVLNSMDEVAELAAKYGDEVAETVARYGPDARKVLDDFGPDAVKLVKDYGDDALQLIKTHGDEAVKAITNHGGDAVRAIKKHGPDAINAINKYGTDAVAAITKYGDDAVRAITNYGADAVDLIATYGDDAVRAIKNHGGDAIRAIKNHGPNALKAINDYGTDAVIAITKYGDDAVKAIAEHGTNAIRLINRYGDDVAYCISRYGQNAISKIDNYGVEVLDVIKQYGTDFTVNTRVKIINEALDSTGNPLKRWVKPQGFESAGDLVKQAKDGLVDVTQWGYKNADSLEDVTNRLTNYINRTDLGSTPTIISGGSAGETLIKQVDGIGEVGVRYDPLGLPIFEGRWKNVDLDIGNVDTVLNKGLQNMTSLEHQAAATRKLLQDAQDTATSLGKTVDDVLKDRGFDIIQIPAIKAGKSKIPDFTWHHHQETGRMQLILEDIHTTFKHNGGFSLWFN